MREACEQDLADLCDVTIKQMDEDEEKKRTGLTCLQQFKEELKNQECRLVGSWLWLILVVWACPLSSG